MVTISLIPLLAMIGLVVDFGWGYYRKELCRTAAEAAAAAGAAAAKSKTLTCGTGVTCQAATACPSTLTPTTDPIIAACLYAKQNGYTDGGKVSVKIATGTTSSPVSGVSPSYWITATVSEQLPQLFSAVLGNTLATASARSTAGVFTATGAGGCVYVPEPDRHEGSLADRVGRPGIGVRRVGEFERFRGDLPDGQREDQHGLGFHQPGWRIPSNGQFHHYAAAGRRHRRYGSAGLQDFAHDGDAGGLRPHQFHIERNGNRLSGNLLRRPLHHRQRDHHLQFGPLYHGRWRLQHCGFGQCQWNCDYHTADIGRHPYLQRSFD